MINKVKKNRMLEESKKFAHEGMAYVHYEMDDKHIAEVIVGGDNLSIFHGIAVILKKVAEENGKELPWAFEGMNAYLEMLESALQDEQSKA